MNAWLSGRVSVGSRMPDDGEVDSADADRAADTGGIVAGDRRAEDHHVVALVGCRQRSPRRVAIGEVIATGVGASHEPDELVREPDLVLRVIDHRVDLAERDIDALDSRGVTHERHRQREHPAAAGLAADDHPIAEICVRA